MTESQREIAELLRSLCRPPELIAANSQIALPTIKAWLRTGRWPGPRQGRLFDPTGMSPRPEPTNQPAIATGRNSGLIHFSRAD